LQRQSAKTISAGIFLERPKEQSYHHLDQAAGTALFQGGMLCAAVVAALLRVHGDGASSTMSNAPARTEPARLSASAFAGVRELRFSLSAPMLDSLAVNR
jgi:hypothetical protein